MAKLSESPLMRFSPLAMLGSAFDRNRPAQGMMKYSPLNMVADTFDKKRAGSKEKKPSSGSTIAGMSGLKAPWG